MFANPIEVKLKDLSVIAQKEADSLLDDEVEIEGIYFQDGASSIEDTVIFDVARIVVLLGVKNPIPDGMQLAYFFGLNGENGFAFVARENQSGSFHYFYSKSITVLLKDNISEKEVEAEIDRIKLNNEGKIKKITYRNIIGVLSIEVFSPGQLVEIASQVKTLPIVEDLTVDQEFYRLPFVFDTPIYLGKGNDESIVQPENLRTVSKRLIDEGKEFAIPPHLNLKSLCGEVIEN